MSVTQAPRWKKALDRALEKDPKSIAYQLSSIFHNPARGGSDASSQTSPPSMQSKVRTLIHRGFLTGEGRSSSMPLLLTTTDIRTPKASQISQNPRIEIAWWFPEVQEQFRISANAYILPSPQFGLGDNLGSLQGGNGQLPGAEARHIVSAAETLRKAFSKAELVNGEFDWEAKRVESFESMSGHMKAKWAAPVPGTPLNSYEEAKAWPETIPGIDAANEQEKPVVLEAMKNFALVVIDPLCVDHVELGATPNQRTVYTKGESGWSEQIVVP